MLLLVTTPLCQDWVIACLLPALCVVAVSRAPSPESNPNFPLPVFAREAQGSSERPRETQRDPVRPKELHRSPGEGQNKHWFVSWRRGRSRRRMRRLWNVSVVCVIVWLCVLIVSFSGCCLIVGRLRNVSVCFYGCVSVDWESAVGSLWNVSVCFL